MKIMSDSVVSEETLREVDNRHTEEIKNLNFKIGTVFLLNALITLAIGAVTLLLR